MINLLIFLIKTNLSLKFYSLNSSTKSNTLRDSIFDKCFVNLVRVSFISSEGYRNLSSLIYKNSREGMCSNYPSMPIILKNETPK